MPRLWPALIGGSTLLMLASAGCDGPGALDTAAGEPPDLRESVTAEAAASLDAEGNFVLEPPRPPVGVAIITPQQAKDLAIAFVSQFGPSLRPAWEREHGSSIELDELRAEPRVYYADTPYGSPPANAHPSTRKVLGPYYMVAFSGRSRRVLDVAVSALNTDLRIEDGRIRFPVEGGEAFSAAGIPSRSDEPWIIAPEQAAAQAAALGAKVAEVPALVLPGRPFAPQHAYWRVRLERPVEVRRVRDGAARSADVVLVGASGRGPRSARSLTRQLLIPGESQPEKVEMGILILTPDEQIGYTGAEVPLRPGATVFVDTISGPEVGQ